LTHRTALFPVRFYLKLGGLPTFHRLHPTLSIHQPPIGQPCCPRS
jgi:hypothetical protein